MVVKKIFASVNELVQKQPLVGALILVIFISCLMVTFYEFGYSVGQTIESLVN
ncbi:hypothetical protein I6N90_22315 [Paenibacillus sp. GSMTC-2017]|uniref:hypothetical protein n=1 Tax=Paenibacillus sp. GSMTC-2017 TaxID=2794350 RepID=UPI0018D6210E|nr:hypothetical protein [Paenibacillus sp. GSMTC-2017]MBH5320531.1 hypothetical protein [Paenibacillus sp. GSMTC-2017]